MALKFCITIKESKESEALKVFTDACESTVGQTSFRTMATDTSTNGICSWGERLDSKAWTSGNQEPRNRMGQWVEND